MTTGITQLNKPIGLTTLWPWFREFIRWEIAPYPGRINTVIRMTITATLVMLIVVTFRIPNAFLAALFSIILARENLAATWRAGRILVLAFVTASLYTLLGMTLFRGSPVTHFFWVIGSLYLVFFVLRTATNYAGALAFALPLGVTLPLWDRSLPSEIQVEGTLWPILIIAVGAGVTLATEALYRIFDRSDPLIASVDSLLLAVQQTVESFAARHAPPKAVLDRVLQYQMIGTGRLRQMLQRQGVDPTRRAQRAGLISLAGRLIDLAANLERTPPNPGDDDVVRLRALAARIGVTRTELRALGGISASPAVQDGPGGFPMLQELERTVALITEVFQGDEIVDASPKVAAGNWWQSLFQPDTFQNPEYQRFALAGCLAASACYVLYNALDWRGIGQTAVLTCIVTALTTVGFSLQAQVFRLAGFVVGGLLMGISAQVLVMPGIDNAFGFALFFAAGTAIAAWFATSSPRLSYFGVQMALSFYFVNLQDAHVQTDLTIARDKVAGVFLGILAMGFIFDRFGTKSDAEQLQQLLVRNVRMLAQFMTSPAGPGAIAGAQSRQLRNQINDSFATLESQVDAARFEFEFRGRREGDVVECARIQRVQPWLRSIYLLRLALNAHRMRREVGLESTRQLNDALDQFLNEYGDKLTHVAAWIAHEQRTPTPISHDSTRDLRQALERHSSPDSQAVNDICQKLAASLFMLTSQC